MSNCSLNLGSPLIEGEISIDDLTKCLPSVLVAPVSGHGMVEQAGILIKLASMGFHPSVSLGASGGSLAIGMLTAYNWDAAKCSEWINNIPSVDIFQNNLFGIASGIFCQNIYNTGSGLNYIFRSISNSDYARENEIIITAHNNTIGRLEIFSTVSKERSVLKKTGPLLLVGSMCQITYLGEIQDPREYRNKLELVFRATSAVPIVFPPVKIDECYYVDGGVSFSSPLNPIMTIQPLKDILYIFPEDIEVPIPCFPKTAVDAAQGYLSQVSRSNYIHDRICYLQSLCCGNYNDLKILEGNMNDFIPSICSTAGKARMVEIFPSINRSLPIMSNHTRRDVLGRIMEQQRDFKYRIFYMD